MVAKPGISRALCAEDPTLRLRGVGPAVAGRLAAAGLQTIGDLLLWFPRRLRELTELDELRPDAVGRWVRVTGRVESASLRYLPRRRSLVTVRFRDAGGAPFDVLFFNQPYLKSTYTPGDLRIIEGVLERKGAGHVLRQGRVLPRDAVPEAPCQLRYAEIDGISEARLKTLLRQALLNIDHATWPAAQAALPAALREELPDLPDALRAMHMPRDAAEHEAARRRFALAEAVELFQRVEVARRRREARPGRRVDVTPEVEARVARAVPFEWTPDQAAAVDALRVALAGAAPMGMLLQGDVGTGKTAVALFAAIACLAAGHQVAFLAPTELLAEQHFEGMAGWLQGSGTELHLLTASVPAAQRREVESAILAGGAKLVVGTHALLSETTAFADLGLVIIDEQHRFGVDQRMALVLKGRDPHVLVMTATPIPRTLTLTLFGDLDTLVLRDKPAGHRPVPAVFVEPVQWARVVRAIRRHVARGDQVYVVCAKIGEDGEKGGAVRLHAELSRILRCGLVHGRMPAAERQDVTAAFRRGEIEVLVGTTVLEVGVDVPAATLIVIIGADRLGLSTLHQLRGRVGRGPRRGLCVLTGERTERTEAVCATTDGFALAEQDLRLRGAGEMLGTRQSGLGDFRALDPLEDLEILRRARDAVRTRPPRRAEVVSGYGDAPGQARHAARDPMKPISVAQARELDRDAVDRLEMPSLLLMENASRGVAEAAAALGDRFLILCGPGNNGGDGLAAARHLGRTARVFLLGEPDPERSPDAAVQLRILRNAGHEIRVGSLPDVPDGEPWVWIDALFGTGLTRPLEGEAAVWVEAFNAGLGPKLCVDIPSGLHGDTGAVLGVACRGDVTVTFEAPKTGLVADGAQPYVGRLVVVPLGLPQASLPDGGRAPDRGPRGC